MIMMKSNLGGEGLMLRKPGSKYSNGRSSNLLKVKQFYDEEAKVTGYKKGEGRVSGMMGALECVLTNGVQVTVLNIPLLRSLFVLT